MDIIIDWLLKNFFSLIVLFVTPLLSYLFSRRKETSQIRQIDVDTDGKIVDSAKDVVTLWESISKKQEERINALLKNLDERILKLETCETEKQKLERRIEELMIVNNNLKVYNERLLAVMKIMLSELSKTPDLYLKFQNIFSGIDIKEIGIVDGKNE
jgi:hypothetical protein